ncbi:MAG: VOC family protein, partial [Acetobacteraceae bacterium]|nr:VOC family protein [Acetobacteraceae bacterium]
MTRPTIEPALGAAAAGPRPAPGPEWPRVGGVALAVRDLARVEAFYREVLGFGVVERTAEAVRLGAGGVGFLDLLHRPTALPDDPATAGLFHTAFLLPSRAELGRWLAHAGRLRQALDGAAGAQADGIALLRYDLESDHVAVERRRAAEVAHGQRHPADAQPFGV